MTDIPDQTPGLLTAEELDSAVSALRGLLMTTGASDETFAACSRRLSAIEAHCQALAGAQLVSAEAIAAADVLAIGRIEADLYSEPVSDREMHAAETWAAERRLHAPPGPKLHITAAPEPEHWR